MSSRTPILLTPGPLTTALATRQAMLTDWGSWDRAFNELTAFVCHELVDVVHGHDSHVCVPLQGSGTFAVEAAIGTLVPRDGKVLIPVNGAYCKRIVRICEYLNRAHVVLDFGEIDCASPERIDETLASDSGITHVAQVHCETGTGILNPLPRIAQVVARRGRRLIVDAMSSFGAIDIDARKMPFDAVIAASGKCLEGVPGMGFVIARRSVLEQRPGACHSLAMDLHDQWTYMQKTGQWRFTPPTHVVAALASAITQFKSEGGQPARGARYSGNCDVLIEGMKSLGLRVFLPRELQAPIIVTFYSPADANFRFDELYEQVRRKGFIIYPGKLTQVDTFRVGCIGAIGEIEIRAAVDAISESLQELKVSQLGPSSGVAV